VLTHRDNTEVRRSKMAENMKLLADAAAIITIKKRRRQRK
jgi:hypothetical protein